MITKINKNRFLIILLLLVLFGQLQAQNVRTLQSNSSSSCAARKDGLIFYDIDLDQCISKSACKKFLIGTNTCTATCPLGYYSYKDPGNNNNYIVCSSSCKYLSTETVSEPQYCLEECGVRSQYKADSTIYCGRCPPELPYANRQGDGTTYYYNCSTQPDQNLIQYPNSLIYIYIQDCYSFIVDMQRCAYECPSNFYLHKKIQGNNYQLCSSTCQYLIRDDGDESYYCQDSCHGSLFKTIDASGNSISYCNTCPEDLPIMSTINSKQHTCSSCRKDQISNISTNSCLDKKEDCSGYVTNGTTCKKSCDSRMFTYPTFTKYKRCETQCAPTYLTDKDNRKCYASQNECPKLISKEGQRCLNMCDQGEYPVVTGGKAKCVWCNDFVQYGSDNVAKCVTTCDSGNYPQQQIYGIKYKFCKALFIYPNIWLVPSTGFYVYKCQFPEVGLANFTCASSCPESFKVRLEDQTCVADCSTYEFLSSDQTLCLKSCAWNFEVQNDNYRSCKKCNPDEIFLFISQKGKCVKYDNSDDTLAKIKQSISDIYTDLFLLNSKNTQNLINNQVSTYQNMVMSRLAEVADKEAKTADDQEKAKNIFSQALDIVKAQLNYGAVLNEPILTCNNYFNIISQSYPLYQTSKAFNLSLDFESLQNCKVSDLLKEISDSSQTIFTPKQLLVSYIKNNHFCIGDECKDSPSLITVSYPTNQTKSRILSAGAQEFSVIYSIPAGQSKEKQACFNYDINGVLTVSQGQIQGTQIACKFTSSSGLIYDPTCKFLDKSICDPPKPSEPEQPSQSGQPSQPEQPNQPGQPSKPQQPQDQIKSASSNSEKLNGAAIAGIVIGAVTVLIIVGVGLACYIRKNKLTKKYEVNYTENNNNQVKETEECNLKQINQITENQKQTDIIN